MFSGCVCRTMLLCFALALGAVMGAPITPEKIQELMQQASRPKVAHVLPQEDENGHRRRKWLRQFDDNGR